MVYRIRHIETKIPPVCEFCEKKPTQIVHIKQVNFWVANESWWAFVCNDHVDKACGQAFA